MCSVGTISNCCCCCHGSPCCSRLLGDTCFSSGFRHYTVSDGSNGLLVGSVFPLWTNQGGSGSEKNEIHAAYTEVRLYLLIYLHPGGRFRDKIAWNLGAKKRNCQDSSTFVLQRVVGNSCRFGCRLLPTLIKFGAQCKKPLSSTSIKCFHLLN